MCVCRHCLHNNTGILCHGSRLCIVFTAFFDLKTKSEFSWHHCWSDSSLLFSLENSCENRVEWVRTHTEFNSSYASKHKAMISAMWKDRHCNSSENSVRWVCSFSFFASNKQTPHSFVWLQAVRLLCVSTSFISSVRILPQFVLTFFHGSACSKRAHKVSLIKIDAFIEYTLTSLPSI